MRRTARVSSKPRTAPDQSSPPSSGPDTEFWQAETSAPPDAQWLRALDAPAHDGDPAFDLAAPQAPITELLPEAPIAEAPAPVPPPGPEPVAELPAVSPYAPPPLPMPEVAAPTLPAPALPAPVRFTAGPEPEPEPAPEPVAEAWVATDAYAPAPVESSGGSWVAAVAPEPVPAAPSETWTVAPPTVPVAGVDDEWVDPAAVVDPAPARAAAPLDLPVLPVPEASADVEPDPGPLDVVAASLVTDPVPEPPADTSRRARRARRSLFGYAQRDAAPDAAVEATAVVAADAPAESVPSVETAPAPPAAWSSSPVPPPAVDPVAPALEWTPAAPVADAASAWAPTPLAPVAEAVTEPAVEWTPAPPVAAEVEPAVEWTPPAPVVAEIESVPVPAVEWSPAPVAAAPGVEAPFYETEAYEATAELVPERAPEGSSVTDWLQPANDDLLPQF